MTTVNLHMDNDRIISVEMDEEDVQTLTNDLGYAETAVMSFSCEKAEIFVPVRRILYVEVME